jgi:dTDP-4-dehydrorhamnose reductase
VIAVLGANGQLGSAFMRLLGDAASPITRSNLDLANPLAIEPWMDHFNPSLIINCAAYNAVDAAESDPETAHLVNATAVEALARESARHHATFVTFSTDYVFDGSKETGYVESDDPGPLSVYGMTKLEGEYLALEANPESLVIRTSWVLSETHSNFAAKMLDLIAEGEVQVVHDQRGRPTIAEDLARATMDCLDADVTGIVHLSNQGETTWFQLAREIALLADLDPDRVTPCATRDLSLPAPRPANSVLDSERLEILGINPLPHYSESLAQIVDQLKHIESTR